MKYRAISLWQPYASLIALKLKQYETRHWQTSYRGLLAIHAAKRWTQEEWYAIDKLSTKHDEIYRGLHYPLPLGAVVCICKLVQCHRTESLKVSELERSVGNFAPGRFAWQLEVVEVFDTPIPARGAQGLWTWERPAA